MVVPWKNGKPLICDVTCLDTLAQSYRAHATRRTGAEGAMAEEEKILKSAVLHHSHTIIPVAIDILGAIGPLSCLLEGPRH